MLVGDDLGCAMTDQPYDDKLLELQTRLNFKFQDTEKLKQVFYHSSYIHELGKQRFESNEGFEFLGDAVLSCVVSELLFQNDPHLSEGVFSRMRVSLVNTEILASIAQYFQLTHLLKLGKGEQAHGGAQKVKTAARVFEALIGAIFLDAGYQKTKDVLIGIWDNYGRSNAIDLFDIDFSKNYDVKSQLQQIVMQLYETVPLYESSELVVDGKTHFKVTLKIKDKLVSEYVYHSKKEAQKILAKNVLEQKLYLNL